MRMKMQWIALVLAVLLLAAGCSTTADVPQNTVPPAANRPGNGSENPMGDFELPQSLTPALERSSLELEADADDADASYEQSKATRVEFSDSGISVSGSGAQAAGTVLSIYQQGVYILSGSCANGQIRVQVDENDDVQLVFSGLTLTCTKDAALTVMEADKVFVTLAEGTLNSLSDAGEFGDTFDEDADAVIFSRGDTILNGSGSLTITAHYAHGIESKDDLVITSGELYVNAKKTAVKGKDCVQILGGTQKLTAGTNGVVSDNDEDEQRGYVWVKDANLTITAGTDGIQAETFLCVDSGYVNITAANGYQTAIGEEDSAKGLKAGKALYVCGGEVILDCAEDGLHSDDDLMVSGGTLTVHAGDDAVHAESQLDILGGVITIEASEEGIEGSQILLADGNVAVKSNDDGVNAAGPALDAAATEQSSTMNPFADAEPDKIMEIRGGTLVVDAGGDGVDSNGYLIVSGGVLLVNGSSNSGNAAIDYGVMGVITGGTVLAAGAEGMAQGFDMSSTQGTWQVSVGDRSAGTKLALTDGEGNLLASFTVPKAFSHVVASVAGMQSGNVYELLSAENISNGDDYGYASQGRVTGTSLAKVTMESLHEGNRSFGGMGGGQRPGGMNPGERPDVPEGMIPEPPDGMQNPPDKPFGMPGEQNP